MPAVAKKLEPAGKHDACFLPRRIHVTGDIDIHELALGRQQRALGGQYPLLLSVHARRRS